MKNREAFFLALRVLLYSATSVGLLVLARLLLWVFNTGLFPPISIKTFFVILFGGLQFDFCTFSLVHLIFIPFLLIPYILLKRNYLRFITKTLIILANIILLAPSIIDIVYYRFTLKRTTFDVFSLLGTIQEEMGGLTGQFISDFWYIPLIFSGFILFLWWILRKTLYSIKNQSVEIRYRHQMPVAVLLSVILLTGARGSFNLRPLGILHATQVAGPEYAPLVENSTFTMIKTFGKEDLEKKNYFSEQELARIFTPEHNYYQSNDSTRKDNVVVIIVESLSAEHMGALNNGLPSFTPFLDSLSREGLLFSNMFSNGKKSLEGIPAVLSGLPAIMQNPFLTSMYSGNSIDGIGKMLLSEGYTTAFFHGGVNGTMNFDGFSAAAGYQQYYGKNEYTGSDADFDGRWGIFDEPYLQYMVRKLDEFSEPFTTCVFTLSSHHPYTIPEKHQGKFPKGSMPIHETIAYADFALQQFFEYAKTTQWYQHTLFIITADHTSEIYSECFVKPPLNYTIPMIWFHPADSTLHGVNSRLCQQTDVLPSIADYLNVKETVYSFGNSVFDSTAQRFVIMQNGLIYQLLTEGNTMTETDGDSYEQSASYQECRSQQQDLAISGTEKNSSIRLLKAIIQQFNNRAISNRLCKP